MIKTEANDPIAMWTGNPDQITFNGLTKREHFAALAMQGLLANEKIQIDLSVGLDELKLSALKEQPRMNAQMAVAHADALIQALSGGVE